MRLLRNLAAVLLAAPGPHSSTACVAKLSVPLFATH